MAKNNIVRKLRRPGFGEKSFFNILMILEVLGPFSKRTYKIFKSLYLSSAQWYCFLLKIAFCKTSCSLCLLLFRPQRLSHFYMCRSNSICMVGSFEATFYGRDKTVSSHSQQVSLGGWVTWIYFSHFTLTVV